MTLILKASSNYPSYLHPLIGELEKKSRYHPVFVHEFAPLDRKDRYVYNYEEFGKGYPNEMCAKSFGGGIGN